MSEDKNIVLKMIVKGAGVIFLGTFIASLLGFVYKIILARYLGPGDYGLISLGIVFLNVATIFALLGLNEGVLRYVAYYKGKKDNNKIKGVFWLSIFISMPISLILSFFIIISSDWIALHWFRSETFSPILKIFAMTLPAYSLLKLIGDFFLAYKKPLYKHLVVSILFNLFNILFVVLFVLSGLGVRSIALAYCLSILLSLIIGLVLLQYKVFAIFEKIFESSYEYKELFIFSLPLFFSGIFLYIMGYADTFLLGVFKTEVEVGIYNVVFSLTILLGVFLTSFSQIFYPTVSEAIGKNNYVFIGEVFETIKRWIFIFTFPIMLLVILFPKVILKLLFGQEYVSGYIALIILTIAYFFNVINGPTAQTLKAFKKTKLIFYIHLILLFSNVILDVLLIPRFGIIGAAIATGSGIFIREIIFFLKVRSILKFKHNFKLYIKYIVSAIVPMIIIYFILKTFFIPYSILEILVSLVIFGVLYIILILLFQSIAKEDIFIFEAIEKKLGLNLRIVKKILKRFI